MRLTIGPMCCGKTTGCISRIFERAKVCTKPLVYINSALDTRARNGEQVEGNELEFTSHNPMVYDLKPGSVPAKMLRLNRLTGPTGLIDIDNYDTVYIDEAQFFPDLVEFVTSAIFNHPRVNIEVFGLSSDWTGRPFGQINDLLGLVEPEGVTIMSSFCKVCQKAGKLVKAHFSRKIDSESPERQIDVGSNYVPVCAQHINRKHFKLE